MTLTPLSAFATTPQDALTMENDATISRGEFLRAAVEVLDIPTMSRGDVPYKRVPSALLPYVRAAHAEDALDAFGASLDLAKSITRYEALSIVVGLLDPTQENRDVTFTDVSEEQEGIVRIAIVRNWMRPLRLRFFGTDRPLTGREGRLLLARALGRTTPSRTPTIQEDAAKPITIRVKLAPKTSVKLPKNDLLNAVWQLLNRDYLRIDKLNAEDAAYSAIEAVVKSAKDPYTSFYRPIESKEFMTQIQGEVSGIGAQVELVDGILTVVSPMPNSPAEKAGLLPGDQILKVDGENLDGLNLTEAVNKVRGPKDSTAMLTIRRSDREFEAEVVRDIVKVPEIEISFQGSIAVVRLLQFGHTTQNDLRNLLVQVQDRRPKGIILDLRNNPGGLLNAADVVVSNFLPKGSVVAKILSRDESRDEVTSDEPTIDPDIPVVVLVNGGSASASEIVAGALQDADRATIVGQKTFGKGTVQEILEFADGSSLKVTIAEWRTPLGRVIDGVGVKPDVEVEPSTERDQQLLRALEILR
jgi:carboxyl-terminal processing protease